jgi:mono/diheme cytochrome c family protein
MKRALLLASVLIAALAHAGEPAAAKPKAPKATAEILEKGRAQYEVVCASCHGTKGDGNGPAGAYLTPKPRHFGTEKFKQGDGVTDVYMTLERGVPGTPMVAFAHLPEDDRWALSWYVAHFLPTKDGKAAKKLVDKLPPLPGAAAAPATPATPATPETPATP